MSNRIIVGLVGLCASLACVSGARAEVVIETVTVGNPGNADDTHGDGYGGVDYAYNIGRFEVTAGEYMEFLNAVAATDTYGLYNPSMDISSSGCQITRNGDPGSYTYDFSRRPSGAEADWVHRPVNYISWGDAARFCNWLHNGQPGVGAPVPQNENSTEDGSYYLNGAMSNIEVIAVVREADATWVIPSDDEWHKAAYHYNDGVTGNYYDYPTSSDSVPGYVNDSGNLSGTGTAFTEGGTDPGNYATYNGDLGTIGIGSPYYRTEVGEWENSDSPYGTFDQGGNVWEWNEAVLYDEYRCIRGGGVGSVGDGNMGAAFHNIFAPTYEGIDFGFRVAEVSEPGPVCGNGTVEDSEECDDNNTDDGDGCSSTCTVESGHTCLGEPSTCGLDCNGNGIPDECDIDCGTTGGPCDVDGCGESSDCDTNGVPDECENDCNGNGLADQCDVPLSTGCPGGLCTAGCSQDLDQNYIPDECGACCTAEGCTQTTQTLCVGPNEVKYNGDGTTCEEACPAGIPTVTSWGLVTMTLLVLAAGTVVLKRRRPLAA